MFMMDLEDKPHPSVAGVDKDISCSVKQTVNNSGTFSIESILKSGGFRCVPPTPPDFQNLTGLRHPHHHQLHGGFSDIGVKKEDLDSDLRDQRPSLLSPGSSLGAVDNATCQEDSGKGQTTKSPKIFLKPKIFTEDDEGGSDDRKKRPRTAFTAAQIKALESEFEKNKYLSVSKRMQLSKQLKLTETQV